MEGEKGEGEDEGMDGGGRWREWRGRGRMKGWREGGGGFGDIMSALVLDMHPSKLLAQRVGTC